MKAALVCLTAAIAAPAAAADKEACGTNMVCASTPPSVAGGLMASGYKALIGADKEGDPMIDSAAAGYDFTVYFYGCDAHKACDSIQFEAEFKADPEHTLAFANNWNRTKRFAHMSINDRNEMTLRYDVSTIGGMSRKNFADAVDWWATMLGQVGKFYDDQAKPPAPAKPAR